MDAFTEGRWKNRDGPKLRGGKRENREQPKGLDSSSGTAEPGSVNDTAMAEPGSAADATALPLRGNVRLAVKRRQPTGDHLTNSADGEHGNHGADPNAEQPAGKKPSHGAG